MAHSLVIVESPTKARTLQRFLHGKDIEVLASMGHVRDLPTSSLGVNVEKDFTPKYVVTPGGRKAVNSLRKAAREAEDIYLATDPDREGEAIAWHIQEILKRHTEAEFHRVTFHEITRRAIDEAFSHPDRLDTRKVNAQQARRILDRLVGYQVSPLLWKEIRKGTSAGRVQSVALKLICERDRAIEAFVPEEYWTLEATFLAEQTHMPFTAKLHKLDGRKPAVPDADTANALATELETAAFNVCGVNRKTKRRRPAPPFITSTMQQAAGSTLRMGTGRTMRLAQQLYEGIELGSGGAVGLITYMRTDSVTVAQEARQQARSYIGESYGERFVPERPNVYRSRQTAQGAHEAIRPTDVTRTPEDVAASLNADQLRLYRLIWNRFVASQMAPAELLERSIEVEASSDALTHDYLFRTVVTTVTFPGFLKVYNPDRAEKKSESTVQADLPDIQRGTACELQNLDKSQHFTEPPKRFTEATLVRELEQNGVGRPSTYASIISTIQSRNYVKREKGRLHATELGFQVNDYLVSHLADLFQVEFTARMEDQLDKVESGNVDWTDMLQDFYARFREWIDEVVRRGIPSEDAIRELLDAFPADLPWEAPRKQGRRVYDDRKFVASLREQLDKGKKLSDRQWGALVTLAAKYADHIPGLPQLTERLGLKDQIDAITEKFREEKRARESGEPVDPEQGRLLGALENVDFQPPTKRGGRTYDDRKFYESLKKQLQEGRRLTDAQVNALKKLLARYRAQVADYEKLAAEFELEGDQAKTVDQDVLSKCVALLNEIHTWEKPKKRGRRVYDDKQFAESIRRQFEERRSLSPKQLGALKKLLSRYHEQIPDYGEWQKKLDLPAPHRENEPVSGVVCPKCGAAILRRQARGRTFLGCSKYPKCRFTAKSVEAIRDAEQSGEE